MYDSVVLRELTAKSFSSFSAECYQASWLLGWVVPTQMSCRLEKRLAANEGLCTSVQSSGNQLIVVFLAVSCEPPWEEDSYLWGLKFCVNFRGEPQFLTSRHYLQGKAVGQAWWSKSFKLVVQILSAGGPNLVGHPIGLTLGLSRYSKTWKIFLIS